MLTKEQLALHYAEQKTNRGYVINFRNAFDGLPYFQSTIRVNGTVPAPRKILEDGHERRLNRFDKRLSIFGRKQISCETRTYVVTRSKRPHLLMTCYGNFFHMKGLSRPIPEAALAQFSRSLASIYQDNKISILTAGILEQAFENTGWFVSQCASRRVSLLRPIKKYPAAVITPTPEKFSAIFDLPDFS